MSVIFWGILLSVFGSSLTHVQSSIINKQETKVYLKIALLLMEKLSFQRLALFSSENESGNFVGIG